MTRWIWRFLIVGLGATAAETALGQMPALIVEADRPQLAQLSLNDCINVQRIEDYLNSIKTVRARFRQVSSTGDEAEGYLDIWRPGRMRVEYDPPVPMLIISDGSFLIYYDRQLGQITHIPLSSTPAIVLTRDNIALHDSDVMITGFEQYKDTFHLTLVLRADPEAGSITLIFNSNPVHLKMWSITDASITDAQSVVTVSLIQADFNVQLEEDIFQFRKD